YLCECVKAQLRVLKLREVPLSFLLPPHPRQHPLLRFGVHYRPPCEPEGRLHPFRRVLPNCPKDVEGVLASLGRWPGAIDPQLSGSLVTLDVDACRGQPLFDSLWVVGGEEDARPPFLEPVQEVSRDDEVPVFLLVVEKD